MKTMTFKQIQSCYSAGIFEEDNYRTFCKSLEKTINKVKPENIEVVNFSKNHFTVTFFLRNADNKFLYFSVSDSRYNTNFLSNILYRTAESEKDYTGGTNCYCSIEQLPEVMEKLKTDTLLELPKKVSVNRKIKDCYDIETLEEILDTRILYGISERGGYIKIKSYNLKKFIGNSYEKLPDYIGAGCNYLGGGVRGAIFNTFSNNDKLNLFSKKNQLFLRTLTNKLTDLYNDIESELGLQCEEDEEGNTDWNNSATNSVRKQGVISAY